MFKNKSPGSRGQSTVEGALHGFASMLALIAAFLVAPQIYNYSADPVYTYLLNSYGDSSLASIGVWVWSAISTACVYFLAKAFFVVAAILIAQRLVLLGI